MKRKIYFTFLIVFMLFSYKTIAQGNIVFLGRDATIEASTYGLDIDLYDSLASWGYTLTYASALPGSFDGQDGLFISETISSSSANSFADGGQNYPVPCVNLEGWTPRQDRFGWVTDNATEWYQATDDLFPGSVAEGVDGQYIVIKDNSHYITQGYMVDDEVRWAETDVQSTLDVTNPCSFKEVGKTYSNKLAKTKLLADDPDFWTMVTIDSAEAGFPNRMFVWGMIADACQGDETDRTNHYGTADFWNIIRRATDWTFGNAVVGIDNKFADFQLVTYPNPADKQAHIRFYSLEMMDVTVTLHTITGQVLESRDKTALAGYNFVTFDTKDYPAGVYFIKLKAKGQSVVRKLVIK